MNTENNKTSIRKHKEESQKACEPTENRLHKSGLDEWNDRLENNLEDEDTGDRSADENAWNYQEEENKDK